MKAVFDVRPGSNSNDEIWHRYHLPNKSYEDLVRQCVGDWVIFRRTGRLSGGAYIAAARVKSIELDPERPSFLCAGIQDYLAFPTSVSLRPDGRYAETQALSVVRSSQIGPFFHQNPIRSLWDADFDNIVRRGFARTVDWKHDGSLAVQPTGFEEQLLETWSNAPSLRRVDEVLCHLPFRAATFRINVGRAYGHTCAFTGLRLMDSRGHYEAHAAHLWSVADGGPDIVRNGICANRTVHWALDQHLLSIDESNRPMVARNADLHAYLRHFPLFGEFIALPTHPLQYPDPAFLARHRAAFLAKNWI